MFPCAIPVQGADHPRVTHPSAASPAEAGFARLACLRRAASVRSEPGSNSPSLIPLALGQRLLTFQFSPPLATNTVDYYLPFSVRFELTEACWLPFSLFPFAHDPKKRPLPGCLSNLAPRGTSVKLPSALFLGFSALPSTEAVFCTFHRTL